MRKKSKAAAYGSEYAQSAGDNALPRDRINKSIISGAMTNEHKHREAFEEFLEDMEDK